MKIQDALLGVRRKLQLLSPSGFARSVSVLAGGTALAQLISVLTLPLITRLFTPSDFSILAVFASLLAILSVSACLRLDVAIPMPRDDDEAAQLLALALLSCTAVSTVIAIGLWLSSPRILSLLGLDSFIKFLWILPVGVWLASAYSAIQFWSTRAKIFNHIARTRVTQAVGGAAVQLGMGWLGIAPQGLLFGQLVSSSAGFLGLIRTALKRDRKIFREINTKKMKAAWRSYDRFPKYATFEAIANIAGVQLPIILIAALVAGPEAGYLMLATRAMAIPMGLIGGAVAQVYLSRASEEFRNGSLEKFSESVLSGLVRVGVGPLLAIGILAPAVFSVIFGKEWARSGELIVWMIPWFIFQFLSSPISMVMHVTKKQRQMLFLTLSGLLGRVGAVLSATYGLSGYTSETYAISGGVFYGCCLIFFSRAAGIGIRKLADIVKSNLFSMSAWVATAVAFRVTIELI